LRESFCPVARKGNVFSGKSAIAAFVAKRAPFHQALLGWQRITMIFAGVEGNFRVFLPKLPSFPNVRWTRITHY
jgi:hypothetical protein